MKATFHALFITAFAFALSSCSILDNHETRKGVSSSLVDYLYPEGQVPPEHEGSIPHLRLPISVGLAFVPDKRQSFSLPEADRMRLLEQVKQRFAGLDYVRHIEVVPDTYMRSVKGFDGVSQISRLYGFDVMALVSYDQVTVTSENAASLLYWTIVGAYFIPGNQNKVSTFVDTVVFDIESRKLLFRAPGVSESKNLSTLVESGQSKLSIGKKDFELAMNNMTDNLALELERFKEQIRQDKHVQISHRSGYSGGGGSADWSLLLLLAGLGLLTWRARRH